MEEIQLINWICPSCGERSEVVNIGIHDRGKYKVVVTWVCNNCENRIVVPLIVKHLIAHMSDLSSKEKVSVKLQTGINDSDLRLLQRAKIVWDT